MQKDDANQQTAEIKSKARALGFDLVGIAPVESSAYKDYLRNWLDTAQHGEMSYLAERFEERADIRTFFPPANSAICLAMNYHTSLEEEDEPEPTARVARYALGKDYHKHIKHRIQDLADWIRLTWPGTKTKVGVDTVPVMEKELAMRAGIGWMGKNTCIIHPKIGSWILLAEVFTSLNLPFDKPAIDRCGTCRRCIDACPTQAITGPYQMDARKCISYLTIEHAGEITADLKEKMGDWIFGCDICQDVCPFNNKAPLNDLIDVQPRWGSDRIEPKQIMEWTLDQYHPFTRNSAMRRIKLPILQRNAQIVINNHLTKENAS